MISKFLIVFLFVSNAMAGANFFVVGRVMRVEDGIAIIKSDSGETRILMKKLSKADAQKINLGTGSKDTVQLRLPAQVLLK